MSRVHYANVNLIFTLVRALRRRLRGRLKVAEFVLACQCKAEMLLQHAFSYKLFQYCDISIGMGDIRVNCRNR